MTHFSIRRELLIALIVALLSMMLLPGLIYLVGRPLFGAYTAGLAGIYTATLQGLLQLQWAPWVLAFAPAMGVLLLRAVWRLTSANKTSDAPARPSRQEPRLGA